MVGNGRHRTSAFAGLTVLLGLVAGAAVAELPGRSHPREQPVRTPVVVIGVAGLAWGDIRSQQTPRLWRLLTGSAAAGAATVRAAGEPGCAADGWLSLSAGQFSAGPRTPDGGCTVPVVRVTGTGNGGSGNGGTRGGPARVTGWRQLVNAQRGSEFSPRPGRLGNALAARDGCETAIGPGAALALADHDGAVRRYRPDFDAAALDCPITVIDGGQVVEPGTGRLNSLARIDRSIGHILDRLPPNTTVLVQGVTKPPGGSPELAVAILAGPVTAVRPKPAFLTATSTRWDGVVRLLDLPTTLLGAVGEPNPGDFNGAPIAIGGSRPADPMATVHRLGDLTRTDRILRRWSGILLWVLILAQLALYAAALAVRSGRGPRPAVPDDRWRRRFTGATLVLATLPVSIYLVTLTHWWRAGLPDLALWGGMVTVAAAVAAAVAALPRDRDPGRPWRLPLAVSLLTFGVLAGDAMTGTPLHRASLFGPSALYGGRYYGFGNSTFAVFAVAALVLAGAVAAELTARNRRRLAVGAVVAIGVPAVAVDTWPAWGADVGGGLALVPGFAVLTLAVAEVRLTVPRLAGTGLASVVVVAAVALADWARPPAARTHAGQFVQEVIDGQAWGVVGRKGGYALASLAGGPLAWLTVLVLALVVLALARPARFLDAVSRRWPTLRPTLVATVLTCVIGAVANDYGIRVVSYAFLTLLPLVALGCAEVTRRSAAPELSSGPLPHRVWPRRGVPGSAGRVREGDAPSHRSG